MQAGWKPNPINRANSLFRPFGEVAKVISGYAFKSSEFCDRGIPVIKISNIQVGHVDLSEVQYVDEAYLSIDLKYHLHGNDILISLTGSHLNQPNSVVGRVALYPKGAGIGLLNQRAGKVIFTNQQECYPLFLYYVLVSDEYRKSIAVMAHGAANQANVSPANIETLLIPLPSLPIQQKVATILSAYDDLIENNTRRIRILEEMAQSIYREWFVNFRFPGHEKVKMVDSPMGKIPEGWDIKTLDDVLATLESGSRPKGGIDPEARGVPSIGAENIVGLGRYDYSKEKFVTREFFGNMNRGHVRSGDVLLYKDGAQIGRKSMFRDGFPHAECCINEHAFILRTNGRCSQNYLFFWLDQPEMTQNIINLNANAAQPGINQSGVRKLAILLPPPPLLKKAEQILEPMLEMLFNSAKRNNILRQTRDLLLPKLSSGELDVSD